MAQNFSLQSRAIFFEHAIKIIITACCTSKKKRANNISKFEYSIKPLRARRNLETPVVDAIIATTNLKECQSFCLLEVTNLRTSLTSFLNL